MAMLGMFSAAALWFDRPSFIAENNIGEVFADPVKGLAGVIALGHQLGFFNILPMYIVFLVALPAVMLLARRSLSLMLGVSFLLWVATGTWRLNFTTFPNEGGWFFNPLAWQFLFAIGFAAGIRLRDGAPVPHHPWVWRAALAYLVVCAVWVVAPLWGTLPQLPLPFIVYESDKTFLTLGRLLHALALAYVVAESPLATILKRRLGPFNPVVLLGKHALVTFVLGTLVSMLGLILKVAYDGGPLFDTLYVASGMVMLACVAATLEWMQRPKARAAVSERAAARHGTSVEAPLVAAE
jgi:hypothetical protein